MHINGQHAHARVETRPSRMHQSPSLATAFILPSPSSVSTSLPSSRSLSFETSACIENIRWRRRASPRFSTSVNIKRRHRGMFTNHSVPSTSSSFMGVGLTPTSTSTPTRKSNPSPSPPVTRMSGGNMQGDEQSEWVEALEGILVEALRTYYQGTPLFSEAEFNTLRDELEHLGLSQVRLYNAEKVWVQATSARDFDRRICQEFDLSEDDLRILKHRLLLKGAASRPSIPQTRASPSSGIIQSSGNKSMRSANIKPPNNNSNNWLNSSSTTNSTSNKTNNNTTDNNDNDNEMVDEVRQYLTDADELTAVESVNERIKWFLFSDASEERFKIMLLYLPAVVMSFVTASVLTILFALLDGEMTISVTNAGRFRLGILSYVAVMATFWISNRFTPTVLDYLDLGQPSLMRAACPICGASVSCLFTGAARVRDERKCGVCGATVAFNRRWRKTYLVSPPGKPVQSPD